MGIIGLIFIFFIACIAAAASPTENNGNSENYTSQHFHHYGYSTRSNAEQPISRFEPSDSFFDEDGNEHEIDEDGYCEECDDYHE